MDKIRYVCGQCGRTARLPDFCCGRAMLQKGSYLCKECGNNGSSPGTCCNQTMEQM